MEPATFVDLAKTLSRSSHLMVEAEKAIAKATELCWASAEVAEQCSSIGQLGFGGPPRPIEYFVVRGEIDEEPVRASWFHGNLNASRRLKDRAELPVRIGEAFVADPDGQLICADLTQLVPAMLTLVRASDRIRSAAFGRLPASTVETRTA